MKKIYTTLLSFLVPMLMTAQNIKEGWPANYGGVMLQGFYWDSFSDTNWTNLESQADEMSDFFDLIWVPNSAYANALTNNMGYHPVYWFDHKSAFGTELQLRSMINTFKNKGTGIIEDIVINHRASVDADWLNFPAETYKGETYRLTASDICKDDESKDSGYNPTGAKDTGQNWGGARDLDHTSDNVQKNVKAYLDFLLNDLGYVGFRYDFVLGYAPEYIGIYNTAVKPAYSVMECWENLNTIKTWINGTKVDGIIQSAAFDFPLKYNINEAFSNGGNWGKLNNACLTTEPGFNRYSVTFIDNHDTGRPGESPLYANIEAANAFILTMPGTPCVWLSHWKAFKTAIKKQIYIRKAAGIHCQSNIETKESSDIGFTLKVNGTNGNVLLLLGSSTADTSEFKLALEGTNYKLYVSNSVDISGLDDIKDNTFTAPDCCIVEDGELCAFFEAPSSWTVVKCWAWNNTSNFTGGTWPGVNCTKVGTNNGNNVWKWKYTGTLSTQPTGIIFNNGSGTQTGDLDFRNGGYYNEAGALQGVVTGITPVTISDPVSRIYTLDGRLMPTTDVNALPRGIYIVNGRKLVR